MQLVELYTQSIPMSIQKNFPSFPFVVTWFGDGGKSKKRLFGKMPGTPVSGSAGSLIVEAEKNQNAAETLSAPVFSSFHQPDRAPFGGKNNEELSTEGPGPALYGFYAGGSRNRDQHFFPKQIHDEYIARHRGTVPGAVCCVQEWGRRSCIPLHDKTGVPGETAR